MQIRQGDVLLVSVDGVKAPKKKKVREGERIILAEGEATGHAHAVSASDAVLFHRGETRFLRTVKPTLLRHEEHSHINLPGTTTFRVIRQREYSPREIRNVAD